ncbi:MAG: DNA translocase FtsK [Peptococcaceae bacterium]|nr:DNA translocase FtsK [Peptococcaceae bacterium]
MGREVTGILIVGAACLMMVALFTAQSGLVGLRVSHFLQALGGGGKVFLPILLGAFGIVYMNPDRVYSKWRILGALLLWFVLVGCLHIQRIDEVSYTSAYLFDEGKIGHGGGLTGAVIAVVLLSLVGKTGSYVVLIIGALIGALLMVNRSLVAGFREVKYAGAQARSWLGEQWRDSLSLVKNKGENEKKTKKEKYLKIEEDTVISPPVVSLNLPEEVLVIKTFADDQEEEEDLSLPAPPETENVPVSAAVAVSLPGTVSGTPLSRQAERQKSEAYQLPKLSLLQKSLKVKNARINKDLADNVKILEDTLENFGVRVKVTHVTQGPAITRYEAQPAPGVKVSKIVNLSDDIALNLAASSVRIEAPVPGKSVVGIEVPNREIAVVPLREVIECQEFQTAASKLSLALGKDITGAPIIADLIKMPHLLIAGATGAGKSVCINTMIHSILFKARPEEVKILLVDPKMVELTNYNGVPHLISPVVTDPKKAASSLKWVVTEMETRYELFAAAGVRDIVRYNFLITQEAGSERAPLPYVVVIIDELADLMMVAPSEVEDSICRLAQMARASGIHLIVATQRPSVDVITGLIKANIPSRIAFAVSSQTDSRTILDSNGAEKLFGRGDMLFYPMGASKPIRVQGCYLTDKEVENVIEFLKAQAKPEYLELSLTELEEAKTENDADEYFYQAGMIFIETGNASVSLLQRRLRIGYTRAARIMDQLESKGVVGGFEGSKPRNVLMSVSQFEQKYGMTDNKS